MVHITRRLLGDRPMASPACCPATRARLGHAALRLAETPGPRRAGAWPRVTAVGAVRTG